LLLDVFRGFRPDAVGVRVGPSEITEDGFRGCGLSAGRRSVGCGLVQTAISVIGVSVPNNANILQGVVTGIGFIGAGAIIRQGDFTTGHATAASIWTVAIMGAAVGYGYYDIGIILTAANLAILLIRALFPRPVAQSDAPSDRRAD
jgi:uncharacterized membrane protein YhiD involved in acid resistance